MLKRITTLEIALTGKVQPWRLGLLERLTALEVSLGGLAAANGQLGARSRLNFLEGRLEHTNGSTHVDKPEKHIGFDLTLSERTRGESEADGVFRSLTCATKRETRCVSDLSGLDDSGDETDPDMPVMVVVQASQLKWSAEISSIGEPLQWEPLSWDQLPTLHELTSRPERCGAEELTEDEAKGELALARAEALLMSPHDEIVSENPEEEGMSPQLRAVTYLHEALHCGCRTATESAVSLLLVLFRAAEGDDVKPIVEALASCQDFPASLAATAARLAMLRPEWAEHGATVRKFCQAVARASPLPVVIACLDLVPRSPTRDTLGFSWLLEHLKDKLVRSLEIGDRVVTLEEFPSDSSKRSRINLEKGMQGEIREIDEQGDVSIRFDDLEKRQWVFRRHLRKVSLVDGANPYDGLACAVTLLCDDAGGPPLCAASARSMLMNLAEKESGIRALLIQPKDEALAKKARKVNVKKILKTIEEYQSQGVSASE